MINNLKEKNYTISSLRFLALMLVIGCHLFEWIGIHSEKYSSFLILIGNYSSVGVQIFLLISGFLYGKKLDDEWGGGVKSASRVRFVLKNYWKILKDYYAHYILFTIPLCIILQPEVLSVRSLWGMLTCWCTFGGEVQLWFIPYILFCYLITPFLYDIRSWIMEKSDGWFYFFILIFVIEILFLEYKSYFIPAWICCYIIGFFIPKLMEKKVFFLNWHYFFCLILLCICMNSIKIYLKYIINVNWQGFKANVLIEYYNWAQVVLAVVIFSATYYIAQRYFFLHVARVKWLDLADKYSYDIYISHMIFVKGMLSTVFLTDSIMLNLVITIIAILISSIVLYYVCRPKVLLGYLREKREL